MYMYRLTVIHELNHLSRRELLKNLEWYWRYLEWTQLSSMSILILSSKSNTCIFLCKVCTTPISRFRPLSTDVFLPSTGLHIRKQPLSFPILVVTMESHAVSGGTRWVLIMFGIHSLSSAILQLLHFVQVVTQTLTNAASKGKGSYYCTLGACHSPASCTRFYHPIAKRFQWNFCKQRMVYKRMEKPEISADVWNFKSTQGDLVILFPTLHPLPHEN